MHDIAHVKKTDPTVAKLIDAELDRQERSLVMIASENYPSPAVIETLGTVLQNKYSEGYPRARYYSGNEHVDAIEQLAIDRAKELFGAQHANVQPHSGTTANFAIYFSFLKPGDTILSMDLAHGGHLSHGSRVSVVGKMYTITHYTVEKDTERINMDSVRRLALEHKPKIIVSGATAYPRAIDFAAFQAIAQEAGAIHLADISHIAGLVVGGVHASPLPHTDIVMTTTHKTLRGPRGAMIMAKEQYAKQIDKAIFPGIQGGPLEHVIAAKAVAFKEAMTPRFQKDQQQTVANAQRLAEVFSARGIRLVSGGTDNHLLLLDCTGLPASAKESVAALESVGISANFNTIPYDPRTPFDPSGIRLGTPGLTARGMGEKEMDIVGGIIADTLAAPQDKALLKKSEKLVQELCEKFPIYADA